MCQNILLFLTLVATVMILLLLLALFEVVTQPAFVMLCGGTLAVVVIGYGVLIWVLARRRQR